MAGSPVSVVGLAGEEAALEYGILGPLKLRDGERSITLGSSQQRTVLAMLNEAARCLNDGIIKSPRDGDVGAVFGIGFPPFRGGPFRYMDSLGIQIVVQRLEDLNARFSGRFEPSDLLLEMARRKQVFYPDERS